MSYTAIGWQVVVLVVAAACVRVSAWLVDAWEARRARTKEVLSLELKQTELLTRVEALAKHLLDIENRTTTLRQDLIAAVNRLDAKLNTLEEMVRVTRPPSAPRVVGPYLGDRRGT